MNMNQIFSAQLFTSLWFYEKREPISFSAALAIFLAMAVLWLMPKSYTEPVIAATEMMAILENMPVPQIEKSVEKKIQDKKIENKVEKIQTNLLEKVTDAPVVNDLLAEKASPSPAKQSKSENQLASTPPTPANSVMQQAISIAARYESILRAYLEKIKRYPSSREARLARPEGVVRVWLELSRTGELIAVGILESSGFNLLDSETIKTIKSGTFPAFPEGAFLGEATHKFIANLNYTISSN
ncbi:TonB family protein [Polynucleobacter kasalickyi]|uniref:Protein TonB n=1 Tax=Polynucleobacter kasalickyi TaxID=1938817 RepID=A0A1W1YLW1_9BURK|nr:TonB family protein [Polynucleobacter kasalickyi]SMC37134.1 protein TonB [Polynucleobacter kasalickyi]